MFARYGPQWTYALHGHTLLMMVLKLVLKGSLFSCFSIWSLNPETDKGQVVVLGLLGHNLLAHQGILNKYNKLVVGSTSVVCDLFFL